MQEFAHLSRMPESTWIVALSQSYLHHTQVLEQQRMVALSQGTSAHATNPYFNSHRLELMNQTLRHIKGFHSMLKLKQSQLPTMPAPASVPAKPATSSAPQALPKEAQYRNIRTPSSDNGYESAGSNSGSDGDSPSSSQSTHTNSKDKQEQTSKVTVFKRRTRDILEQWYIRHMHSPYVDHETATAIAQQAGIGVLQVRKWLSNRRNRDKNTRHRGYKDLCGPRVYYTYTGIMDTFPSHLPY